MNYSDIMKLFRDFESYDRHITEYSLTTEKAQRFNDYLEKMKRVIDTFQRILQHNGIIIADNDKTRINEHEIKCITAAATCYFKLNKREATPACQ